LTIFIFYGAYVFAQKTPGACPIILVVDSAGGGDFEFFFLVWVNMYITYTWRGKYLSKII
jgi:hypothetical protein